jgi:N-methylhydantoinase B/oxoprolinase/acetone carboxylase alpha subunit
MARAAIAQWPDGDYSFEEFLDSDGLDGPPQRIKVTLRVRGDEITADCTGTAPQVPTAINSPRAFHSRRFIFACVPSCRRSYRTLPASFARFISCCRKAQSSTRVSPALSGPWA